MQGRTLAAVGLAFGVVPIAFALGFADLIVYLGRNIPQDDIVGDYVFGLLWAMIIGFSIFLWPVPKQDRKYLFIAWAAKCAVTLGFMLFYESHYAGVDMYGYFYGATHKWFHWSGFRDGTVNMRQLCWLHGQVFPNSFHLMKTSFSLVGFVGVYLAYRAAVSFTRKETPAVLLALALFPSVLFWSSTLGKDPIVLFGICLYVYGVAQWQRTGRWRHVASMFLGVAIAACIRIWLGPLLLAPLTVFLLVRLRNPIRKLLVLVPVVAVFFFTMRQFQENFNIDNTAELVSTVDSITHSADWQGGSGQVSVRFTNLGVMLAFIPIGAFTALFRPLPGEVNSLFGILAGLENLLLLWLLFRAVRRTKLRELWESPVLWAVALIAVWSSFYGFASYQNLGAAVRYRLQILPVLLGLLFYLGRRRVLPDAQKAV